MNNVPINPEARRVIRRCRIIAWLLPLGSLALLLGGISLVNKIGLRELLFRVSSPLVVFALGLFYLVYIPASVRIYYVLLLKSKGVFKASQRQNYQEQKLNWEKYLFKAALLAGILIILLAISLFIGKNNLAAQASSLCRPG